MIKHCILFSFCSLVLLFSCKAQQKTSPVAPTQAAQASAASSTFVQWSQKLIDIGKVKKGEKRELFFEFTNTSGKDVQIDLVDACHCTTTDYPRGIIAPGGKARVDAIFDSAEKDASETIEIRVIFKQNHPNGDPIIEVVHYRYELVL
jgi:hypothetical protein